MSCSCDDDDTETYTWQKEITYMATLNQFLPDTGNYLWSDSSFLKVIWDSVLSGELPARDPHTNKVLDTVALKRMISWTDTIATVHHVTMMDTTVIVTNTIDRTTISDVAFKERISYNAETNELEKEVIAIGPAREIISPTGLSIGKAVMFWVAVNEEEEED